MTIKAGKPTVITGSVTVTGPPVTTTGSADGPRVWWGEGPPPPQNPAGFAVGDTYVDKLSGTVYRLDPGE